LILQKREIKPVIYCATCSDVYILITTAAGAFPVPSDIGHENMARTSSGKIQ
jgi:hypothetical protein